MQKKYGMENVLPSHTSLALLQVLGASLGSSLCFVLLSQLDSENMQKYAGLYAEVYLLHILHLYALPTLLMKSSTGKRHLVSGCHQALLDVLGTKNSRYFTRPEDLDVDLEVCKSAAATAKKLLSSRAGSALRIGSIIERKAPQRALHYWSITGQTW